MGQWQCIEAVIERLEYEKLLGPQFLYTATGGDSLGMLRKHGTYRLHEESKTPQEHVYCCELQGTGANRTITQVDDSGPPDARFTLFDYLRQNADDKGGAVIVWDRSKLTQATHSLTAASGAAFEFNDPTDRRGAIVKVIVFKDL